MKLGRLAQRAKQMMDQRGGSEALKADAQELRDIARGQGTLQDKAKRAAEALREPGADAGAGAGAGAGAEGQAGGGAPAGGQTAQNPPGEGQVREDTPAGPADAPPREEAPTDTPQGPPPRSDTA